MSVIFYNHHFISLAISLWLLREFMYQKILNIFSIAVVAILWLFICVKFWIVSGISSLYQHIKFDLSPFLWVQRSFCAQIFSYSSLYFWLTILKNDGIFCSHKKKQKILNFRKSSIFLWLEFWNVVACEILHISRVIYVIFRLPYLG